jgi:hypothetical protein
MRCKLSSFDCEECPHNPECLICEEFYKLQGKEQQRRCSLGAVKLEIDKLREALKDFEKRTA